VVGAFVLPFWGAFLCEVCWGLFLVSCWVVGGVLLIFFFFVLRGWRFMLLSDGFV